MLGSDPGTAALVDIPSSLPQDVADVQKFVEDFMGSISQWAVVDATDKAVVIYDIDAVTTNPGDLTSVTFDFSDGSTLSLVGLPADLHHLCTADYTRERGQAVQVC